MEKGGGRNNKVVGKGGKGNGGKNDWKGKEGWDSRNG